ncbi:putative glycosyltransferase [Heterosigma akashiwo virus 01]|uniref:Putative glycosyltransferase n=1 Tax=Heterosigma akashiwo virus 01 TaxID=97195 RepID=A0A1C9C4Z3_HAV01|nr:putative glycosyltransferase [Heterosigma akashiwo virus 01]AOM63352.1 putative glycosyltransferase [Heterosigma akashiwo virus 01]
MALIKTVDYETLDDDLIVMKFEEIAHDDLPYISIITPTKNRSLFYELMLFNWNNIDYPKDRCEWIIVEDGDDDMQIFIHENINRFNGQIRYFRLDEPTPIGFKRNFGASKAKYDIIVHIDDDDYYPPESVLTRVRILMKYNTVECTGCLKVRCFNLINEETFEAYDPVLNFSESTLAYRRSFWKTSCFDDHCIKTEGFEFIKDRYEQCIDIPSQFIVCQFTHLNNTVNRRLSDVMIFGDNFLDTVTLMTRNFIKQLQMQIALQIPENREALEFIKKCSKKTEVSKHIDSLKPNIRKTNIIREFRLRFPDKIEFYNKELVYYCGIGQYLFHTKVWDYDNNDVGGSEESVLNLCKYLALYHKYKCYIYNVRDDKKRFKFNRGSVTFLPYYDFNPSNCYTNIILWRDPSHLDMKFNAKTVCLDLHDVIDPDWITDKRFENVTWIMVKSIYHQSLINTDQHVKTRVIPNGIIEEEFENKDHIKRHPYTFLSTSSADRCLTALLDMYPEVIDKDDKSSFVWCYGFDGLIKDPTPSVQKWIIDKKRKMNTFKRFINAGNIPVDKINMMYLKCDVFLYPAQFPEIDCISLTKAMAAGCFPIFTDVGALREKCSFGGFCIEHLQSKKIHEVERFPTKRLDYTLDKDIYKKFVEKVFEYLDMDYDEEQRKNMQRRVLEKYGMKNITLEWKNIFVI